MNSKSILVSSVIILSCFCGLSLSGAEIYKGKNRYFMDKEERGGDQILLASSNNQDFFEVNSSRSSSDDERFSLRRKLGSVGPISCNSEQCSRQSFCDYTNPKSDSCPSYTITTAGFSFEDYGRRPGWEFSISNGRNFKDSTFSFENRSSTASDPCRAREVGISFNRRSGALKIKKDMTPVKIRDFKNIILTFDAKVNSEVQEQATCKTAKTMAVIVDLRFGYSKDMDLNFINRKFQKGDLVGFKIFGHPRENYRGKKSQNGIFFRTRERAIYIPKLTKLPRGNVIPDMDNNYRHFEFNINTINAKLGTPPPGFTRDDAYINGIDIYSSVRGADVDFTEKSIRLTGR